jgi:uncharacterized membrane protein required for colicin V production
MLDSILLGVIVVFAVLGAWSGLLFQVLRLAAAVGGVVAASKLAGPAMAAWPILEDYPAMREIAFAVGIFTLTYFALSLVARLIVSAFRKAAPALSWTDRLLGALAGGVKGAVLGWFMISVLLAAEAATGQDLERLGTRDSRAVALAREWPMGRVAELAQRQVEEVRVQVGKAGEAARELGGKAVDAGGKAVDAAKDAGGKAVDAAKDAGGKAVDTVKGAGEKAVDTAKDAAEGVQGAR